MFKYKLFSNFYKYKRKLLNIQLFNSKSDKTETLNVLFFGTDKFSLPSLQAIHQESKINLKISQLEIVTSFKNPSNPVRAYAEKHNLKRHSWPIQPEICKNFNIGIVVSFGHMIPSKIISSFPLGMVNVHASLLPKWRGAAPIIYSIMNGDEKTGVSIMKIEPKRFDVGAILYQNEIKISENTLMPELHDKLGIMGGDLLLKLIKNYPGCFKEFTSQNEELVSYAPKITNLLCEVQWANKSARQIYNLFRALYSFKHLSTKFNNLNIKIIDVRYNDNNNANNFNENSKYKPGFVEYSKSNKTLKVLCKDNNVIEVVKLKVEGKKVINAEDFNNGFLKRLNENQRYFS